jgi:DNA repair protein RecN (Recombination protein N)
MVYIFFRDQLKIIALFYLCYTMLQTLYIKNYALIDETRVEFNNGLVTITGETGAGKSILLGALGLIIGNRADGSVLRDKENKCIVEVVFDVTKLSLSAFFAEHELDEEDLCIIRREILPGGKSRAFVNDTPVQVNVLKLLGECLVDIHSQHETLQLHNDHFQMETLDLFAGNTALMADYTIQLKTLKEKENQIKELREKESKIKYEHEFITFQYNELNEAGIKEGEQEQLEKELTKGEHSEEIKNITTSAIHEISESEENLVSRVYALKNSLQKIAGYDPEIGQVAERLQQVYNELKDILISIENIAEGVEFDPQRKLDIEDRLDVLYTLQKKHKAPTIAELLQLLQEMEQKLEVGAHYDEAILQLENEISQGREALFTLANTLHKNRHAASAVLEKDVLQVLKVLGLADAKLKVEVEQGTELNKFGTDKIKYLFSANKGMDLNEVSKVASGGEISRLMLAIKALISSRKNQPTIIFDEIDAGVSGNIADKLGQVMQRMSKHQQVIAITHLPQIASKGDMHIKVEKMEVNKKTVSILKPLTESERIQELAVMLSGEAISDEAINNARVLLGIQ